MKLRIVLSVILAALLGGGIGVALGQATGPPSADGIGTSPSVDDDPLVRAPTPSCAPAPQACGTWVDVDEATAYARARAGEAPNDVMFTMGATTCADAIGIAAARWPGRSAVFYVKQVWRASVAPP